VSNPRLLNPKQHSQRHFFRCGF